MNSPQIRPQIYEDNYVKNWKKIPEKYISENTKSVIESMEKDPDSVGLKKLDKSARDQVRVYKDLTEYARSIMGELTAYVSKKLEKIYALELCISEELINAQIALLKAVFFNEKGDEKETFTGLFENCEDPLSKLQYINYFIPQIKKFTEKMPEVKKKDLVFITIRQMINSALKSKGKFKFDIDYKKLDSNDIDFINNVILDFEKLPPVIRCAILFNDLKRFKSFSKIQSYSISVGSEDELTKSGESNTITYIISDASN